MLLNLFFGFGVAAVVLLFFALFSGYMRKTEGFLNVPTSLFVAKVTPGGNPDVSALSPGPAMTNQKLLDLPAMRTEEAESHWAEMTSERCYRSDIGESLKKTRNFLQRTNNYSREHPDSCSAPNHEFVGTFYTPFDGVGRNPATGTRYPPSTQACTTAL
jgi:hypothetical protein